MGIRGATGPWPTRETSDRPPLTESAVIDAALSVLDELGADGVTMRAVADRLGVTAPTVYWHVNNKDGLIDRLFDRLCGEVVYPDNALRWHDRLHALAHEIRRVLRSHRDAARLAIGRFPLGPNGLRSTETVLGAFSDAGLNTEDAAHAAYTYFGYVTNFCYAETVSPAPAIEGTRDDALSQVRHYLSQLPTEEFPHTVASAEALTRRGLDHRFEYGLTHIIQGLTQPHV